MLHRLLVAFFFVLLVTSYYVPQFIEAETRERCDDEVCHVKITNEGFVPRTLLIKIGTTVVWTNTDDGRHTVTSGMPGEITAPLKSLLLNKGDTYTFTFHHHGQYEGSYKYFDQVTRTMRGEIIVERAQQVQVVESPEPHTIRIDYNDPQSGIKKIVFPVGSIKNIGIEPDLIALIISVENVLASGKLEISIDRNLLDARADGRDNKFMILLNGKEAFYDESSITPTERTLQIVVPPRSSSVEIRGTISHFINAITAIDDADEFIGEQKSRGIVVDNAESKLLEAKELFDNRKYVNAEASAKEAKTIASNISNTALIARKAIDTANDAIMESDNRGFDVSDALQLFALAEQEYIHGNYDNALNLAQQANNTAIKVRDVRTELPAEQAQIIVPDTGITGATSDQTMTYLFTSIIAASAGATGAVLYMRFRKKTYAENAILAAKEDRTIDLNKIFVEKHYLREDDKEVIKYIVERGGSAFESEIRAKFNMPKSTVWRLVRRLERENLVEVKKTGGHNLIRIKEEYVRKDNPNDTT